MFQPQTLHRCLNSICKMGSFASQLLGLDKWDKFDKCEGVPKMVQHIAIESKFLMICI